MRWQILTDITKLAKSLILDRRKVSPNIEVSVGVKYTTTETTSITSSPNNLNTDLVDAEDITKTDRLDAGTISGCITNKTPPTQATKIITTTEISTFEFNLSMQGNLTIERDDNDRTA